VAHLRMLEGHVLIDASELRIHLDTMLLVRCTMPGLILGAGVGGRRFAESPKGDEGGRREKRRANRQDSTTKQRHCGVVEL